MRLRSLTDGWLEDAGPLADHALRVLQDERQRGADLEHAVHRGLLALQETSPEPLRSPVGTPELLAVIRWVETEVAPPADGPTVTPTDAVLAHAVLAAITAVLDGLLDRPVLAALQPVLTTRVAALQPHRMRDPAAWRYVLLALDRFLGAIPGAPGASLESRARLTEMAAAAASVLRTVARRAAFAPAAGAAAGAVVGAMMGGADQVEHDPLTTAARRLLHAVSRAGRGAPVVLVTPTREDLVLLAGLGVPALNQAVPLLAGRVANGSPTGGEDARG